MLSSRRQVIGVARAVVVAFVLSCGDSGAGPDQRQVPAAVEVISGSQPTATAGVQLSEPLVVRVVDASGQPIAGQKVSFVVTAGGGSLSANSAQTNAQGLAETRWTLGTIAGTQRLEARAVDASNTTIVLATFATEAKAGPPTSVTKRAGDAQRGVSGLLLAVPLEVAVADQYGNGVLDIEVTWRVAEGEGTISARGAKTNGNGIAMADWQLGVRADHPQRVEVSAASLPPVTFTASGVAGRASHLAIVSGSDQSAPVATTLPGPLVVRVSDAHGNPIPGVPIAWELAAEGWGSVSPESNVTNEDGEASTRWTLGTMAVAQQVRVTADGVLWGTFYAHGTPGAPSVLAIAGGHRQTGKVGTPAPLPLIVLLQDQYSNGVPDVVVTWNVLSGDGSLASETSVTDGSGAAHNALTFGSTPGPLQIAVSVPGTPVRPTVLETTAVDYQPPRLEIVSGKDQRGPVLTELPSPLVVRVKDQDGKGVPDVLVHWSGSNIGQLVVNTSLTDANGELRARWTLSGAAGPHAVTASSDYGSVTFNATATRPGDGWHSEVTGVNGSMNSVHGTGPSDIWVAGRAPLGAPVALSHYDGHTWTPHDVGGASVAITSLWATSPSDVWGGTDGHGVIHFDGTAWSVLPAAMQPAMPNVYAVWAASPTDAFAVGDDIWHFNGVTWERMPHPAGTGAFMAIWGSSPRDVFATDQGANIYHYDGASWSVQARLGGNLLDGIYGSSASNVFAAGMDGRVFRYDGTRWTQLPTNSTDRLPGVWVSPSGTDVYVSMLSGAILHDKGDGTGFRMELTGEGRALRIWGPSASNLFVGSTKGMVIRNSP